MCGSIAIPFRAAPAVSDICVSNDGPIRHYFPSRRRQAWTARARVTGISPLRGSLRAAPTACGCGWTGVSLLDCRRGSGRTPVSPAAMRNSPPQAVLWTDGNRSAPYLAVFDAGASRTDGLGASSNVASASLSGASRQRTYPSCRIFYFQRSRGGRCDPLIMYRHSVREFTNDFSKIFSNAKNRKIPATGQENLSRRFILI